MNDYNNLLKEYNSITELKINPLGYIETDLSSTGKTVRDSALEYFSSTLSSLASNQGSRVSGIREVIR